MNVLESVRIAFRALNANKARSILTMLGVIIGVAAVILLVAIGTGVQDDITGQIEGIGSNLLFVFPADFEGGSGPGGGFGGKAFSNEDVELIERRVDDLDAVVPVVEGQVTAERGNRSIKTLIQAGTEKGDDVFAAELAGGRHYNASEVQAAARVVGLGATVADELFPGGQDPVGEEITIEGQRFLVIAHYEPQGGALTGDQDNQIYMPFTTAQRLLGTRDIGLIIVKAANPDEVDRKSAQIERLLRPSFGDNVSVFSQEQTLSLLSTILGTLTFMLAGIAGISLLVGGIGIMNIMLVSVTERTREIGIRKAVGARTYDILSQFVIEAVALSIAGGVIGIALGALGAWAIDSVVPTQITGWAVAMAFIFAAAVGVFFGVYPAWRASMLDPIEALRYE